MKIKDTKYIKKVYLFIIPQARIIFLWLWFQF